LHGDVKGERTGVFGGSESSGARLIRGRILPRRARTRGPRGQGGTARADYASGYDGGAPGRDGWAVDWRYWDGAR